MISDLRAVGVDHHAVLHNIVAGCDQLLFSFQLHDADPAGRDLIDSLQIAELRDRDPILLGSFHDRNIFLCRNLFSVDRNIYHNVLLPPLKIPYPK